MHDSTTGVGLESHQLWWTMLLHRTLELAPALPPSLRGIIQLEITTDAEEIACFHLVIAGARTSGGSGAVARFDTLVKTSESKLHALLFASQAPKDALVVSGDARLFQSLLEVLQRRAAPRSLLEVRCQP
jgi:hypothetical protein